MMATEAELDARWHALSLLEKRAIFKKDIPLNDIMVPDILRLICTYLGRYPNTFYSLVATCRRARDALGDDFYPYADKSYLDMWILRLEKMARSHGHAFLYTGLGDRYRTIYRANNGDQFGPDDAADVDTLCVLDNASGLLMNTEHTRSNGFIYDRNVWSCFTQDPRWKDLLSFSYHKDMVEKDPSYQQRSKQLKTVHEFMTKRRAALKKEKGQYGGVLTIRDQELLWDNARAMALALEEDAREFEAMKKRPASEERDGQRPTKRPRIE